MQSSLGSQYQNGFLLQVTLVKYSAMKTIVVLDSIIFCDRNLFIKHYFMHRGNKNGTSTYYGPLLYT